jgi:diguanylate cyclase (GGDEF)-like protein
MTTVTAEWVVVVEAEAADGGEPIEVWRLRRLLEALEGLDPVGLHSAERIAVQIRVPTPDPAEALRAALADFAAALGAVEPWDLRVVRAEVLSREEFDADCRAAYAEDAPEDAPPVLDGEELPRLGEQLLAQVFQDPLTQLPARGLFMGQLERALAGAGPSVEAPAVVVVAMGGLAEVNARWGRAVGDEVVVASARRLAAAAGPGRQFGRIGDEEFAVVVERAAEAETLAAAAVAALGPPVAVGDIEVGVSATAGIARSRRAEEAGDLLAQARAAARGARGAATAVATYRPGLAGEGAPAPAPVLDHDPRGYLLVMQRAAMAANESCDLAQAAGVILGQLCAHLGFAAGHLWVLGEGRLVGIPLPRSAPGPHDGLLELLEHLRLDPGQGLAGRVLATARPAWVTDIAAQAPELAWAAQARACGLNAAVAVPVVVGREVVAVLELFAPAADAPDDALVEVLRGVGGQLGRVVERHRALIGARGPREGRPEA